MEGQKQHFHQKKKYTFWPSWGGFLSALWVEKDHSKPGGHIEKYGKCMFFKFLINLGKKMKW